MRECPLVGHLDRSYRLTVTNVACVHAGGWGLRALTGGLPPAVPLWSLRLALAYTDSGLGLAAARVAEQRAAERAILLNFTINPAFMCWLQCHLLHAGQALFACRCTQALARKGLCCYPLHQHEV